MASISLQETVAEHHVPGVGAPRYEIVVARPEALLYNRAVEFSSAQYERHFNCHLTSFYPAYFCLLRERRLVAVCGFRGGDSRLFLEQYLDDSPCTLLEARFEGSIDRRQIVELGGFAVRHAALALPFMSMVAPMLQRQGFTHAVATATLPVRRCLSRLGVPFEQLGPARRERLEDESAQWGSYYAHRPAVIAGSIEPTFDALAVLAS